MQAFLAVLLSSHALYPPVLGFLAAAVTYALGGMVIAEDVLRGDPCSLHFQNHQLR
jgi:hypothetical protein